MKVLIVEFLEREDNLFEQTLEWLSSNLNITPTHIKTHIAELSINPFTRIVIDTKGNRIYLTAKEFDLFIFCIHTEGRCFQKNSFTKMYGVMMICQHPAILHHLSES